MNNSIIAKVFNLDTFKSLCERVSFIFKTQINNSICFIHKDQLKAQTKVSELNQIKFGETYFLIFDATNKTSSPTTCAEPDQSKQASYDVKQHLGFENLGLCFHKAKKDRKMPMICPFFNCNR